MLSFKLKKMHKQRVNPKACVPLKVNAPIDQINKLRELNNLKKILKEVAN